MESGRPLRWLIMAQLIVTLALLGFAFALGDSAVSNIVVGAVIAHWLNESTKLGRQVSDERMAKILSNGPQGATVVTTTTKTADPVSDNAGA